MMEDRWLSVDDIAAYLGIKRDTVYRWISERNMPGHKIGQGMMGRRNSVAIEYSVDIIRYLVDIREN